MIGNRMIEKVATFIKQKEVTKEEIWLNIEHLTYLTINKEIVLEDAERCALVLFKRLEELEP